MAERLLMPLFVALFSQAPKHSEGNDSPALQAMYKAACFYCKNNKGLVKRFLFVLLKRCGRYDDFYIRQTTVPKSEAIKL